MKKVNLNTLELNEFIGRDDRRQHCRASFPLLGIHGSTQIATVYFEIEPGDRLGRHTDSAEELLVVLEGELSVQIGPDFSSLKKGNIALVPRKVSHDLANTGNKTAKVLGVFGGANNIIAEFEKEWLPTGSKEINTALLK